jgi:glycosyltransferase involved in cell wall biosynthesis
MRLTGRILWTNPFIIYTPLFLEDDPEWDFDRLLKSLEHEKCIFFKNIYWSIEGEYQINRVKKWLLQRSNKNHRYIFLCNSRLEASQLQSVGIEAYLIHQNAFVDPNLFYIDLSTPKIYSAIYNATLHPYKRYELASKVDGLSIVSRDMDPVYVDTILKPIMPLNILNQFNEYGKPMQIERSKLIPIYNQAFCGLALSEKEGAMFASMEYLLCGLPVVSTKSVGGRDYFFTKSNATILDEDDVDKIADAVKNWALTWSPEQSIRIREDAISMQRAELEKFKILLGSLLAQFENFIDPDIVFSRSYTNSMGAFYPNASTFLSSEVERLNSFAV